MPERPLTVFQIRVKGFLDPSWAEWFNDLVITPESDQAALHGILIKIRNMNLTLISVNPAESNAQDESQVGSKGGAHVD